MNAFLSQMDVAERRRRLKRQDRTQALGLGTVGIRVLGSRYEQASEALVLIADWQTPMVSVFELNEPVDLVRRCLRAGEDVAANRLGETGYRRLRRILHRPGVDGFTADVEDIDGRGLG